MSPMRTSTRWHGHFNFVVDIPKKGGSASELGVAPEPRPTVVEKRVALHAEILPIDFQLFFHLVVPPFKPARLAMGIVAVAASSFATHALTSLKL